MTKYNFNFFSGETLQIMLLDKQTRICQEGRELIWGVANVLKYQKIWRSTVCSFWELKVYSIDRKKTSIGPYLICFSDIWVNLA